MKKYDELTRLLDFMEENIDLEHIRKIEQLQYDTINYKRVERLPLTICTAYDRFDKVPCDTAFDNPEKMLFNEILCSTVHSSYNSVCTKDDSPLMIRSNHGNGIIASMFGCKLSMLKNQMPCVESICLSEAKKSFAKGAPDIKSGLGRKVIETYIYYHERLKSYPKCYRAIRITQPDLQGPFNILHLILGDEALLLIYSNPPLVKYMIDVIAHTYVNFRKELDLLLTDKINDAVFVHGFCCGGRVLIKADKAVGSLPPEMYKRYEAEPDSYIFDSFSVQGGGSLHYCGNTTSKNKEDILDKNLRCINYGNPELHNLNEEYVHCKNNKIAIVGWGLNQKYSEVKKDIEVSDDGNPIKTGLTLMCKADNIEHGREILKNHRGY